MYLLRRRSPHFVERCVPWVSLCWGGRATAQRALAVHNDWGRYVSVATTRRDHSGNRWEAFPGRFDRDFALPEAPTDRPHCSRRWDCSHSNPASNKQKCVAREFVSDRTYGLTGRLTSFVFRALARLLRAASRANGPREQAPSLLARTAGLSESGGFAKVGRREASSGI